MVSGTLSPAGSPDFMTSGWNERTHQRRLTPRPEPHRARSGRPTLESHRMKSAACEAAFFLPDGQFLGTNSKALIHPAPNAARGGVAGDLRRPESLPGG